MVCHKCYMETHRSSGSSGSDNDDAPASAAAAAAPAAASLAPKPPRVPKSTLPPGIELENILTRETKRAKLLQYAERVWHITSGTDDERIDAAIERTRAFFESLGIKTQLSGYALGQEAVDAVVAQLEAHGMTALGEHKDISLEVSRAILQAAL